MTNPDKPPSRPDLGNENVTAPNPPASPPAKRHGKPEDASRRPDRPGLENRNLTRPAPPDTDPSGTR